MHILHLIFYFSASVFVVAYPIANTRDPKRLKKRVAIIALTAYYGAFGAMIVSLFINTFINKL